MKRILLMLLTGCLLTFFGCSNALVKTGVNMSEKGSQVTGKYVHMMSPVIYIELKDDGTYCHQFGKRSICGKYVIDGNHVIFTFESGKPWEFVIEGKSLISKEGDKFTKQ